MEEYNPDCLEDNVRLFDKCLQKYQEVYKCSLRRPAVSILF